MLCLDTDECATDNRGGCEQQCINFIGSYRCACNIGYVMASDNRHCNRKVAFSFFVFLCSD